MDEERIDPADQALPDDDLEPHDVSDDDPAHLGGGQPTPPVPGDPSGSIVEP